MSIRKILDRFRRSSEATGLEEAKAKFEAAARDFAKANRAAREAGLRYTPEMEEAAERLNVAQQRLERAKADFDKATDGPKPVELTEPVVRKVRQLFLRNEQAEAIRLLEKECGRNLPLQEDADAQGLERVRLAVVKLAGGSLVELRRRIEVAKSDWRDVLSAAEYPEASKFGFVEYSKLNDESRRELEARDRRQYEEWLNEE